LARNTSPFLIGPEKGMVPVSGELQQYLTRASLVARMVSTNP
jgi:hypothetical protein